MHDGELNKLIEEITLRVLEKLEKKGDIPFSPFPQSTIKTETLPYPCPGAVDSNLCESCGHCVSKRLKDVQLIREAGAERLSSGLGVGKVEGELARYIDHTLLKPEATKEDLRKLCEEAIRYGFYSVCVNSANVRYCAEILKGTGIKVVAVVGFPLGAMSPEAKAFETRQAIRDGAREIDMVINIGALKSKDYKLVLEDIQKVVNAAKPYPVKVIIETGLLSDEEKIIASALAKAGGADFVKTSTGFGPGGAKVEDIELIRRIVGGDMGIKASGGIRTKEAAEAMLKAGATRIGASASVAIITGGKQQK